MTARGVTGFSPYFGARSLLNCTKKLEKWEKQTLEKTQKIQWRGRPEVADGSVQDGGPLTDSITLKNTSWSGVYKRVVFQKGGFGGCSTWTKTGTRVHSECSPGTKTATRYVRMFPRNENWNEGTFAKTTLLRDDRQITHLICARLNYDLYMTFSGGVFEPFIQEKKGSRPKTPPKKVI